MVGDPFGLVEDSMISGIILDLLIFAVVLCILGGIEYVGCNSEEV